MKKNFIKAVALFILTFMLAGCVHGWREDDYTSATGRLLASFAVISDAQILGSGSPIDLRYRDNLKKALIYSCDNNADAIIMVGDMVNDASDAAYRAYQTVMEAILADRNMPTLIYSPGNHEMLSPAGTDMQADEAYQVFRQYTGLEDVNSYQVIKGVPIVSIATDAYSVSGNTPQTLAFLRESLANAAIIAGGPILVANHAPIYATVQGSLGSDASADSAELKEVLKPYPNVIYLSGHTHYPILDERNIWQKDFTAYNTGTMSYTAAGIRIDGKQCNSAEIEFSNFNHIGWTPVENLLTGAEQYGNFGTLIRIYQKRTIIDRINFDNKSYVGEALILSDKPMPDNFKYTDERALTSPLPKFKAGTFSKVSVSENSVKVNFKDAAHPIAVESYVVELRKKEGGQVAASKCIISDYYTGKFGRAQYEVQLDLEEAHKNYEAVITPYNCWGKAGKPMIVEILP